MHPNYSTPTVDLDLLKKVKAGDFEARFDLLATVRESGGTASRMIDAALEGPELSLVRTAMLGGFDAARRGPDRWGDDRDRLEDDWSPIPVSKAVAYVAGVWPDEDAMVLVAAVLAGPDAPPLVDEMFWHPEMIEAITSVFDGQPEVSVFADEVTWRRDVGAFGNVWWTSTDRFGGEDTWYPSDGRPMARTLVSSGAVAAEERRHKPVTGSRSGARRGRGRR